MPIFIPNAGSGVRFFAGEGFIDTEPCRVVAWSHNGKATVRAERCDAAMIRSNHCPDLSTVDSTGNGSDSPCPKVAR